MEQKLTASGGSRGYEFGRAVAATDEVVVVGAHYYSSNYAWSGAAYVFRYDGAAWVEEQRLEASDGFERDQFGWAVSVLGGVAVIGAPIVGYPVFGAGSAYVFRYDGTSWVEEQQLTASDGSGGDEFGRAVAVAGDIAVVGAPFDGEGGAAYVFRYDGARWVEEQRLAPGDVSTGDEFGRAVSISGAAIVVGARLDDDHGPSSGAAYVFRYDGTAWVEEDKLTASDGSSGGLFGESVAISGAVAFAGAPSDGDNGLGSGSAYLYTLPSLVAAEPGATPAPFVVRPPCRIRLAVRRPSRSGSASHRPSASCSTTCSGGRWLP